MDPGAKRISGRARRALCRALPWAGLALVPLLGASAVASCVIADPEINLPSLPRRRPVILRDQVVPTTVAVLGYFPENFSLAVEADPNVTIEARLFVDYDALSPDHAIQALAGKLVVSPAIGSSDAGVREITLVPDLLPETPRANECHVIEAIVAFGFQGIPGSGRAAHSPEAVHGGDSVIWFYSPSGDLGGCPHLDGGLDGAFPDSPSEAAPLTPDGGD